MSRKLIASAAALLLGTAAQADMIAGWDVSTKPDSDGVCSIQHNYIDKNDGDAKNSVVFTFGKAKDGTSILVMVFGYSKWDWTKGDKATADLIVGDTVEHRAANWEAATTNVLVGTFSGADPLLQPISRATQIALRFDGDKDNEAWFEIPDAGQAIGAVQICRGQIK
ncbi:hypothetical protein [uncultured Enterovirga sp.]|uniref:hypothetical protein n=1 Tax=uncultured Enterovirga sp. TaxID=2026352 RepID=UPI0035CC195E